MCWFWFWFLLGADEFFDPAADASSMNTFTKRDHVFAKLNLQLQGGSFTLLHRKKKVVRAEETAFMQLEFSGIKPVSGLKKDQNCLTIIVLYNKFPC